MAPVKTLRTLSLAAAASLLAAVFSSAHDHPAAGEVVGVLGLDLYASGQIVDALLAVQEKGAREKGSSLPPVQLRHTRSKDGGATWSKPTSILPGTAKVFSPRRGAEPQIASSSSGERLVVIWTEPGTSPWGSGPLASAVSADGGKTWKKGPSPADDGTTGDHNFVDVASFAPNGFLAVWLDSRDGGQGLRSAASKDGGVSWGRNVDVERRTCECCANRLNVRRDGAVDVIYRGRDPRDMYVARTKDGGSWWMKLGVVAPFGWEFDGCPEVAGALAWADQIGSDGEKAERLYALVWTGKESDVGVWVAASNDQGKQWKAPVRMGNASAKQLDMASSNGCAAAVWDEYRADVKRKSVLFSAACAKAWSRPQVLSSPEADASYPVIVGTPKGVLVAWTERTGSGEVAWKSRVLELQVVQKTAAN
jgi:hypothetical protein